LPIFISSFSGAPPKIRTFLDLPKPHYLFKSFEFKSNEFEFNLSIMSLSIFLGTSIFCESGKNIPLRFFFPNLSFFLSFLCSVFFYFFIRVRERPSQASGHSPPHQAGPVSLGPRPSRNRCPNPSPSAPIDHSPSSSPSAASHSSRSGSSSIPISPDLSLVSRSSAARRGESPRPLPQLLEPEGLACELDPERLRCSSSLLLVRPQPSPHCHGRVPPLSSERRVGPPAP